MNRRTVNYSFTCSCGQCRKGIVDADMLQKKYRDFCVYHSKPECQPRRVK